MRQAVIVSTARTPLTKSHRGEFNITPAAQLAAFSVKAAVERSGTTLTRYCASGLQSIAVAAGRIVAEGVDAMIAGGVETISGMRPGNNLPTDMDPWLVEHKPDLFMAMIDTADVVAERHQIPREEQDAFSPQSPPRDRRPP